MAHDLPLTCVRVCIAQPPKTPRREDRTSKLALHMPEHLRLLVTLFSALEFGLNSLSLYQHTPDFNAVKRAVESSSQRYLCGCH